MCLMQNAQTDQLTGFANRKTFDECVARVHELIPDESVIVTNERRGSKPGSYWLIMVDIDHFKSVNGHAGAISPRGGGSLDYADQALYHSKRNG